MRLKLTLVATIAAAVTVFLAAATGGFAQTGGGSFTAPVQLSNPPTGGEPSIATDPFGGVFVAGPQGIPSGVNKTTGVGYWVSRNDAKTFSKGRFIGSYLGGGDSDLLYSRAGVLRNRGKGTLFVADLEAAATAVCKSTDGGKTFGAVGPAADPNRCTKLSPEGQVGPSDDRPWLTADPGGRVYLTYHEFVSAQPLGFRSDNAGNDDFANPCGSIVSPTALATIEPNVPTDITGGTLVARPVVDRAGNLYVLFVTTTQKENAAAAQAGKPSGTFSQVFIAVSRDHCKSFNDYTVFNGQKLGINTVQFGDIFNDLAIDGAGNLYVVAAGYVGRKQAFPQRAYTYMFRSSDQGKKWSAPRLVAGGRAAHMLPAATGGPKAGQLAIGYFETENAVSDPNSLSGRWTYSTAETTNANGLQPKFKFRDVNNGFIYHHGQICNAGILCGTVPGQPGDRSLLDFTSVALDQHGCPVFTFAGNPTGTPTTNSFKNTYNFVTRQRTGCF